MAYNNNKEFVVNEEQIASMLNDAVKNVEGASASDLAILDQLKKLFKKNVGFSRRSYVAAYFIKQMLSGYRPRTNDRGNRFSHDKNDRSRNVHGKFDRFESTEKTERSEKTEKTERSEHPRSVRAVIDESVSSTIFISVGRNRHVYPRDLVGLLISVAGMERERIGDIRVLTNYSFIQLYSEDCEKVIQALNNYEYRGRKLSVSYSKQKIDEASEPLNVQVPENVSAHVAEDDRIPADVSNESKGIMEHSEEEKIAKEQSAFAAAMQSSTSASAEDTRAAYAETTDDGQVKSHFGSGAAY